MIGDHCSLFKIQVNGFVYITSVLVSLEGRLSKKEDDLDVLYLLSLVFQTICTAMRFEPANAKVFYHEICKTSLCDTLRLMGCFTPEKKTALNEIDFEIPVNNFNDIYRNLFVGSVTNPV